MASLELVPPHSRQLATLLRLLWSLYTPCYLCYFLGFSASSSSRRFTMLSRASRTLVPSVRRNIAAPARAKLHLLALQKPAAASQCQHQQKKTATAKRSFHTTRATYKGITPESADPKAPSPQPNNAAAAAGAPHVVEATPLSDQRYHEVSELYLDELLAEVERVQEEGEELEAEYSVLHPE